MSHYTKLWGSIVHSTVWRESPQTKVVWITLLALADTSGYVGASIPGLADAARVSLEECLHALDRLRAPDPHSRTKDHDGRRLEDVDGGFVILNYKKHREGAAAEVRREQNREAARRSRERKREAKPAVPAAPRVSKNVSSRQQKSAESAQAEAEAEAEALPPHTSLPVKNRVAADAAAPSHTDRFTATHHRDAYLAAYRWSRSPRSLDHELALLAEGGERLGAGSAPAHGWPAVGQALHDLAVAGGQITPRSLAGFLRGATAPPPTATRDKVTDGRATLSRSLERLEAASGE